MRWWERIIPVVVTALVFGAGYGWAGDISYPGGSGAGTGISFSPTTPTDWTDVGLTAPDDVSEALDSIASMFGSQVVTTSGSGSPETVTTCTAKPCFYVQTDMAPPVVWAFNGTNGTAVGWDRVNDMRGMRSPLNVSLQDCNSDGTICPNPYGAFIIDTGVFWAGMPGSRRDANGSMYESATADAQTDFVGSATSATTSTHTFTTTNAQWDRSIDAMPNTFDTTVCRDSATFAACSDTGATCGVTIATASPDAFVIKDESTGYYWPVMGSAYDGCNDATPPNQLTVINAPPVALTSSDTIQTAIPDGTHGYTYYHRWLAQLFLTASEEFAFYPAVNAISNGYAETDCAAGTWAENGTGDLDSFTLDVTAATTGDYAVRGNGCRLDTRGANTDSIDTPAFTTQPNTVYVIKAYVRINSNTNTLQLEVIDNADAVVNTSGVTAWHILGATPIEWATEASNTAECFDFCYVIVKFRSGASQTSAKLRVYSAAGTDNIGVDEVIAFPSPTQNMQLNPLIKDGVIALRLEGDSRSNETSDYDFGEALDDILADGVTRPNLSLADELTNRLSASSGRMLYDIVNGSYSTIRGQVSDYTLIYLGVNDAVQDKTAAQFAGTGVTAATSGYMLSTVREVRKSGSIPIIIVDNPYAGNVDSGAVSTWCSGGNCATMLNEYFRTIIQNAYFY